MLSKPEEKFGPKLICKSIEKCKHQPHTFNYLSICIGEFLCKSVFCQNAMEIFKKIKMVQ